MRRCTGTATRLSTRSDGLLLVTAARSTRSLPASRPLDRSLTQTKAISTTGHEVFRRDPVEVRPSAPLNLSRGVQILASKSARNQAEPAAQRQVKTSLG